VFKGASGILTGMISKERSFSLAITDKVLKNEKRLILISACLPLVFQFLHFTGVIQFSPFDFFMMGGRQNFLPLIFIFVGAGFSVFQTIGVMAIGTAFALTFAEDSSIPLWVNILSCWGVFSFFLICFHIFGHEKKRAISVLYGWVPFLYVFLTATAALELGVKAYSNWTFDGVFWGLEKNIMGGQIAFQRLSTLENNHPLVGRILDFSYDQLHLVCALVLGFGIRYGYKKSSIPLFFIVSGTLAGFIYGILPAVGPNVTMHVYGLSVPFGRLEFAGNYVKNCMPSMHLAWALAVTVFAFGMPNFILKTFCSLFLVLTFFSTMANGEHYLIDLIVAIPFSLIFMTALEVEGEVRRRDRIFSGYFLLILFWYAGIVIGFIPVLPPIIIWILFLLTPTICVVLEFREKINLNLETLSLD
jgi:hypothetical protein